MTYPIFDRLQELRIIALLPEDIPLQKIIPLADALLAAPVQAVLVELHSSRGQELITDLKERAGGHMLVGAVCRSERAGSGPAQFHVSPVSPLPPEPPWIPLLDQTEPVMAAAPIVAVRADLRQVGRFSRRYPDRTLWAFGVDRVERAIDLMRAGASACVVPLWRQPAQTMADTIMLARRFNAEVV